jgi:hypothetical protein
VIQPNNSYQEIHVDYILFLKQAMHSIKLACSNSTSCYLRGLLYRPVLLWQVMSRANPRQQGLVGVRDLAAQTQGVNHRASVSRRHGQILVQPLSPRRCFAAWNTAIVVPVLVGTYRAFQELPGVAAHLARAVVLGSSA